MAQRSCPHDLSARCALLALLRFLCATHQRSHRTLCTVAGDRLRPLLEKFERYKQGEAIAIEEEQQQVTKDIMVAGRKMHGLPINCVFTEMSKIIDAVKLTVSAPCARSFA